MIRTCIRPLFLVASTAAVGLVPAAALVAPPAFAQEAEVETPDVLPGGPGRDETFYVCTACHGSAIVRQQGMTRELWSQTIDYMVERQKMEPLEAQLRALIVNYLGENFPPRRRIPTNPFLAP